MDSSLDTPGKILSATLFVSVFLAGILLLGNEIVFRLFRKPAEPQAFSRSSSIVDWPTRYPFEDKPAPPPDTPPAPRSALPRLAVKYAEKMSTLNHLGEWWRRHIPGFTTLMGWEFALRGMLSDPRSGEWEIRLANGWWTRFESSPDTPRQTAAKAEPVLELSRFLATQGIPFLYVQPPHTICPRDPNMPPGIVDYGNENIDRLLRHLERGGVVPLDLRRELHRDHPSHYTLFFKTDHHWVPQAGFWTAGLIERELSRRHGLSFDSTTLDPARFRPVVFPSVHFGVFGQRVSRFLASPENLVVPVPLFETDWHLSLPGAGVERDGTFADCVIDREALDRMREEGGDSAYMTLLCGNHPLVRITNRKAPGGPRILLLRDSFALAVAPYLVLSCSRLDLIDNRPDPILFNGSIQTYIAETRPDAVVLLPYHNRYSYR